MAVHSILQGFEVCVACLNHQFPIIMDMLRISVKYSILKNYRYCKRIATWLVVGSSCALI
jgi:hypothetical protein